MSYINDDFLLESEQAKTLYKTYADKMPIFDYHCHLSENVILEDKPFSDLYEIWLGGDHYKWRLMRNYGVSEEYITGGKSNKEKFLAYCRVLGTAFGNPLYHWSQLELKEFFGCETEINEKNAEKIWSECNAYITKNSLTPSKLISSSRVKYLFTTNEIFDDLAPFEKIRKKNYSFKVAPAFRADKIMNIESPQYNDFVDKLGKDVVSLDGLEKVLESRLKDFIACSARAADISLQRIYEIPSRALAEKIFAARRKGAAIAEDEVKAFKGYLTYYLMKTYAAHGIVTELHIGPIRNNNTRMFGLLGADTGYDSISSESCIESMSRLFDALEKEGKLPKTIVFNLNPKMNSEIMTLIGCFQSDEAKGKIQYGAAWWFLDNKVGMERHLQDMTATGHIASFVGMLTDSRSFLSYPRHKYFRRILCNYLGGMMSRGEMTADLKAVGKVVEDICYNNAVEYFKVN